MTRVPRRLECGAVGLALVALMVQTPRPPGASLDASARIVLGRSFAEGAQFGTDLVYTYGPLGFLMLRTYDGVHFASLLAWQVGIAVAFAAAVLHTGRRLAPLARALYYGYFALLGTLADPATYLILAGLLGLQLVREGERERGRAVACLLLALLAAVKFTHLLLGEAFVAIAAGLDLFDGRPRRAAARAGLFAAGFTAIWLLCGQRVGNLGDYLATSFEVSRGYEDAMSRAAAEGPLWAALVALAGLAAYAALRLADTVDRARVLAATAALVTYLFVTWKYGFVRAGGHTLFFFLCALLPVAGFPALLGDGARLRRPKRAALAVAGIACLAGIYARQPELLVHPAAVLAHRLAALPLDPIALRRQLDEAWERERRRADLPQTRAAVGGAALDVLGFEQAVAYLNDLPLRPRPVFQSYVAFTPELARRNEAFFRSDRAPEFVLQKLETIDDRLPMLDDSLVLRVLVDDYRWLAAENGFALWRRERAAPTRIAPEVRREERVPFGQRVELGALAGQDLWARIAWEPSALGALRALLYKPPQATLTLEAIDGARASYRLPRLAARTGFLLDPWIDTDAALLRYARGEPVRRVRAFRVDVAPEDARWVEATFALSLSRLPGRESAPPIP